MYSPTLFSFSFQYQQQQIWKLRHFLHRVVSSITLVILLLKYYGKYRLTQDLCHLLFPRFFLVLSLSLSLSFFLYIYISLFVFSTHSLSFLLLQFKVLEYYCAITTIGSNKALEVIARCGSHCFSQHTTKRSLFSLF